MRTRTISTTMVLAWLCAASLQAQNVAVGDTAPAFMNLQKYEINGVRGIFSSADYAGTIIFYNFLGHN